ncbi:MAG: hypothetical protein QG633_525, partial [Patescibacteria group bacterium]|nr:hypothetical protein [Patescibacteria group bacterium]
MITAEQYRPLYSITPLPYQKLVSYEA